MRNRKACCILSGCEVFKVFSRYEDGPMIGDPDRIGPPLDEAWRVTLALADGTTSDVTVHADVLKEVEDRLPELWGNAIEAHAFERKHWEYFGARQFTSEQTKKAYEDSINLINNVPLGIVKKERWSDVNG